MDLYQSERLIYRAFDAATDTDFYFSSHSDPSVFLNTWKGIPQPMTKKRADFLLGFLQESLLFVVICKKPQSNPSTDGDPETEPIGIICLKSIPANLAHNRCAELGVELKRDAQGQGYGPEAMRWALDWAFETANLHRVQLEAYEWNERALASYKRVGFREEGRLRQAIWRSGRWWDELILGILEDEWREMAAPAAAAARLRGVFPEH
jgi:RimJ/RimL family protein N-acetyltransferase